MSNTEHLYKDIVRIQKVMERECRMTDWSTAFERFLEFVLAGFDISGSPLKRPFSPDESRYCLALLQEWTMIMQERTKNGGWYDILGEFYMNGIAGRGKKSGMGQFFSPPHICDFMAKTTDPGENGGESVQDCACGSGRMLLAANALHPGNRCYAQDLDRICCMMAACNFLIHGIRGEVVCGDALDPTDFREGWRINEVLGYTGIPTVSVMKREDSVVGRSALTTVAGTEKNKREAVSRQEEPVRKPERRKNECVQLSLF